MVQTTQQQFQPGNLVRLRDREWVVLPETREDLLRLRPLGGSEDDSTLIYLPLEPEKPVPATFELPDPDTPGSQSAALLLRDALRLKLRAGAGPFRSFGNLNLQPRAYQLVPLLMALKLDPIRLLVADDVGIGKTIEACLIARELLDRGEIERLTVICPPHLCEQWQQELTQKFSIDAKVVRTGTASRLERGLRPDESIFEVNPFTVVSLDYIKADRRREDFLRACPEFVIVDEAHTCVQSNTTTRHQRYQLLRGLAESEPRRSMVLLTATPHSGDDTAFHNLLGLLEPRFTALADIPDGESREQLRSELALHFVQRRRGDIKEWNDETSFPVRESRETTYQLTGAWGKLFDEVLDYARTMVREAQGGTKLQQRMSWWAALALLRCVSSSPSAASQALRTRLRATEGRVEQERVQKLDQTMAGRVLDEDTEDSLYPAEVVPAGNVEEVSDSNALKQLIDRADALRGPDADPKLASLITEVKQLVEEGFSPAVFCRFIATAHYVGEQLKHALSNSKSHVIVITGELTPDQRQERVEALSELEVDVAPVLVATDCLSEGVNLQSYFNAVIHYDLTWNPTRHEQREGRADRYGQTSSRVRTLMLYGENNPVDGAVLRVILRKAEKIRKELGVAVPVPMDNNKVVDAIVNAVLTYGGDLSRAVPTEIDFGETEVEVDQAWQVAKNRMRNTIFAQRSLKPNDVLPEWNRTTTVLGSAEDVTRFVRLSAEQIGVQMEEQDGYFRLTLSHFPKPLQERLEAINFKSSRRIAFRQPVPTGATYVHRTHPLVSNLADHVAEQVLSDENAEVGTRSNAVFTRHVATRTVLYLLRLRNHIQVERRGLGGRFTLAKSLLAEECLTVATRGEEAVELLSDEEALSFFSLQPDRNMENGQKSHLVRQALNAVPDMEDTFERFAHERAESLLSDHSRVCEASRLKNIRYKVLPALPVDKIGIYVFMPVLTN